MVLFVKHPLGSPYNFYSWADQINDCCQDVILPDDPSTKVSLVANFDWDHEYTFQTIIDRPNDLYTGAFIPCPNFTNCTRLRDSLGKKSPCPWFRCIQELLRRGKNSVRRTRWRADIGRRRDTGASLVGSALDVRCHSRVVFDTLAYSAVDHFCLRRAVAILRFHETVPVWVLHGDKGPWTPGDRGSNR